MAVAAFALASGNVQAQTLQDGVDFHGLGVNRFQWERGEYFEELCTGQITFTNSGTEALARVMIEAESEAKMKTLSQGIAAAIKQALGV